MRSFGSISSGTLSWLSLARASSTPSSALNVIVNASSKALNVGSMPGRARGGSIIRPPYAWCSPVQRITQRRAPPIHAGCGGGNDARVAEVTVHHRRRVMYLDGHACGGQQFSVADAVVAPRIVAGDP